MSPINQRSGNFGGSKKRDCPAEQRKIYELFLAYLKPDEFVGAGMARKYFQMGFTRARCYANYKGGKKYDKKHEYQLLVKGTGQQDKEDAADVFFAM